MDNETCMECHSDPELTRVLNDSIELSLFVDANHFKGSVHEDLECVDCHAITEDHPDDLPLTQPTCANCHEDINDEYKNCVDCHGEHDIKSFRDEGQFKNFAIEAAKGCAGCHSSERLMSRFGIDYRRFDSYFRSYHGLAALSGSPNTATCISCHETHSIRNSKDSLATTNSKNPEAFCARLLH